MIRGIDFGSVADALSRAPLWPIAIAATLGFGIIACKAIAWRILLGAEYPVPIPRLINYTVTSYAGSVLLPLRAGELLRLWLLRDRDGVPVTRSAAVAMAEKLLDIVSMLLVVAPLPWLVDGLPASVGRWIAALAVAVAVALIMLRLVAARLSRASWVGRIVDAMSVIQRPRVFVATVAVLVVSWLIDLAMVGLVMCSVGIDGSIGSGLLVLFAINVSIAIPTTPGQLGALELGAMIGLDLVGVSREASLAFAVLYHALQAIPTVIAGLALNARLVVSRTPEQSR